ncbi:CheR family methyltransferase [Silvanigrella aquatica]|uniref:protein-glutamate O-methyltransferase n=1 Tax=Silvanigrella aquatica TaxID=1915309 RepID=A0A1L4CYX1_9BACT|nr:protein-glutamate O-methyltransferase CheR [Silvanigrella aquatica]APJ03135.1 hypothetical protein AXG55_04130 [Silvanigrella aquatica]
MHELNDEVFLFFSRFIESEIGIQYNETNRYLLLSRIQNIAKFLNFSDIDSLWKDIKTHGVNESAKSLILDIATNNETSFFRDPHVFDFFKNEFILNIMKNKDKIRIWSAAASTGQEAYSLAMIMSELNEKGLNKSYEIIATDISERVLKQAENGTYSQLEIQRGLPMNLMVKYFDQVSIDNSSLPFYKVKKELSSHIKFMQLNLLNPWHHQGNFDIIFCRNVLIYQSVENKKQIISRFAKMLLPGGYLILGGAESLLQLSNDYDLEVFGNASVHKLKADIVQNI